MNAEAVAAVAAELPLYRCHKDVRAAKILIVHRNEAMLSLEGDIPVQPGFGWFERHKPEVGGYFVIYKDGYTSYSPAVAFEEGYTKV